MTPEQFAALDPFDRFQLERYGNILPREESDDPEQDADNALSELDRLAAMIEMQTEIEHFQL